ncbi:MAG: hypothetical protein Q4E75_06465 [bacterium]|nr:hypothetical protein [bacterium]
MKKIFLFLFLLLLVTGCGKFNEKNIINNLSKKVKNLDSYHLTGTLEIYRNEEKYTYSVESSYKKDDLYKVDLINKNNNHEQIILKNEEGIFVITPTLNKSFKFQSDWPYNNSQIYLLQPIINDLNNDSKSSCEKTSSGYILKSKVNYSSEKDFNSQKIYLDKNKNIVKIEVLDNLENVKMSLNIIDIDYKAKFDNDYFNEEKYSKSLKEKNNNKEKESSSVEDIVYPMYVPIDTTLSGQDVVKTDVGERVILTFSGESPFTVVQENISDDDVINFVYGDPYLILDTVGSITDYSVSWISNGIEYSVLSDTLDVDELLEVAQSINVKAVAK